MINYIVKTLTAKTFEMHYNIHLNIAYNIFLCAFTYIMVIHLQQNIVTLWLNYIPGTQNT